MNWALILWSCPLLNLLNSAEMPWKGFESFLIQRLHACSYREDVKFSDFPWSPTQMGLGPFGQLCKWTPWSLEQVTILNENDKTSLSNLYPRTLSGLRTLRNPFCLLAGPFGILTFESYSFQTAIGAKFFTVFTAPSIDCLQRKCSWMMLVCEWTPVWLNPCPEDQGSFHHSGGNSHRLAGLPLPLPL